VECAFLRIPDYDANTFLENKIQSFVFGNFKVNFTKSDGDFQPRNIPTFNLY